MLNLLKKLAKFAAISVVGLYTLIWALSPYVANHFLSQYLETQQLELDTRSTIRYNPFLSKVTIEALSISKLADKAGDSKKVFSLAKLVFEVDAYKLLSKQLNVTDFVIDGLYLSVNKEAGLSTVAGIDISAVEHIDSENIDSKNIDSNDSEASEDLPFQLVMASMTLKNSMIDIVEGGQQHQLQLNDININALQATQAMQDLSITLTGDLDGADITLSARAVMKDGLGGIDIEIALVDIDINKFSHLATPHIEKLEGLMSYRADHKIELTESGISIDITDLEFNNRNLTANKNGLHLSLAQQKLKTRALRLILTPDFEVSMTGDGEFSGQGFTIYNKVKEQVLLASKEIRLNNINISADKGQFKVSVNNIAILESYFSDNTESELPALTQFESLNINDTILTNKAIAIDAIELAGFKVNAQLDKNKVVKNLIISMEELSAALATNTEVEAGIKSEEQLSKNKNIDIASTKKIADKSSFSIKLNRFSLSDNADIQFLDSSVSPVYKRNITVALLSAGPFDNQLSNQESIIKIEGDSNQYANFDITVTAKPFLEIPHYHVEGQINEINLPGLSSYIKSALGYEIESGQLDLGIDVNFSGTEMDGESHVLLRGIKLTAFDNYEDGSLSDQTSIPFNAALSMLKDSDGNVDLDLPLSGDINGPSFGLSGFLTLLVKQATIIGAREYLSLTLFPYAGLITVVIMADKHILKVQINDLNYSSTETDVPTDNEIYLSEFSALLNDKPDLQIKLCGVASAADIGKANGSDITSKQDLKKLSLISEQRASNFKQYMVDEADIDSSRLLLCKPQIDSSEDAIPHLRFET
ncbi:MAG: DUF748 domain-containing protein [Oleispira sp.]|nr:DUF748 domain-containing protein [Oleispira sp.]MBL4880732.1 DUF748 domain-containing protein [Oleispira sp.]